MITRAVVVPHPPLLVPELVPGAVDSTAAVRQACLDAVRRLTPPTGTWIAVGVDTCYRTIGPHVRGSFHGFGVDLGVTLASDVPEAELDYLPLPALIAGWLREQVNVTGVRIELVPETASTADCAALGAQLTSQEHPAGTEEVGLLVLGDGSSRHSTGPPGWVDERALGFDAEVREALATADAGTLLAVDPGLATELQAHGRAAWQVLAGFARTTPGWRAELLYSAAPFGVAYHVAVWERE